MASPAAWGILFLLFASCTGIKIQFDKVWQKLKTGLSFPVALNMAPKSVDDMYNGCESEMERLINEKYLPREQKNKNFLDAWAAAGRYYNSKSWPTSLLKKPQIMAVYAYTLNDPPLYKEFNKAVRAQRAKYKTDFQYHTLHFYLTMALRSLKNSARECVTSYRRTGSKFKKNVLNKEIRFGAFTSSSAGGYSDKTFGTESCFEIYTCFGADISGYSEFEEEKEVLIPPYEVFKVKEIKQGSTKTLPCKVVYRLQSTKKTLSKLNCALSSHLHGY
ncbi:PREDICTED: GPI-linked NAD(P)(+)--arginine ADP-ribosyltransferase 1-like [Cyprinodon variegatus]|uniref:NAD(P)(+)--arginine ADP-ribosyltransferase n=1 Tax=Cyprinodon variegatus TaxID=28743 RepID=A0A3Q2GEJ7_CYPVA|nr:PREDICTED: GPI-linked NAD(P)(+)--arginine ADP-ribosyltransferase 1-like [Cyprinodon variegatus]